MNDSLRNWVVMLVFNVVLRMICELEDVTCDVVKILVITESIEIKMHN